MMVKTQIRGHGDGNAEQINELKEILSEMKEEAITWWRYEKARDDIMRAVWMKDHPELVKNMPKFPIHLLWQSREKQPTHHE